MALADFALLALSHAQVVEKNEDAFQISDIQSPRMDSVVVGTDVFTFLLCQYSMNLGISYASLFIRM